MHLKKLLCALAALICAAAFLHADDDVITRDTSKLPAAASAFLETHFKGEAVAYVKIDKGWFESTEYKVVFANGAEVEFDKDGAWREISVKTGVPAVPPAIADYVAKNFPTAKIVKIEKKRHGYEIKLSNRLEAKFDKEGHFVKLDD